MTIKEFFSFKTNKCFWLNIVGMVVAVILLLFGVMKWLDTYTRHGEAVVVPDVKGMTVEEASKMFRNNGLVCVVSDSTYVKDKPAGIILELNPGVGQKVKEGRIIYLTINTLNIPLRVVPNVADNSSLRQAQAKVLASGFKLNEPEMMSGEKDWVYGVKYKGRLLSAGEEIPLGASLTLMVGNGTEDILEDDSLESDVTEPVASESSSTQDDSWF
ncbi:PASTA domain-containing protein [Bacteroides faecichinchillae]|nr:PASTA domain-containing protein [Bacteroides faecichinchillae]THG69715.1 PASTA domain-containing protein [Bacteroides faecichinchillae]